MQSYRAIGDLQRSIEGSTTARKSYDQGIAIVQKVVADHPDNGDLQAELARLYNNLAIVQKMLGESEEALASQLKATEIWQHIASADAPAPAMSQG